MKAILKLVILSFFVISCKNNPDSIDTENNDTSEIQIEDVVDNLDAEKYYAQTGEYPDGTYCSEIEYYNPSTGTRRTYNLDVEVENGELTVINWPNGGWLDETHFNPEDITNGECEFTSDRGYKYTVILQEFGGCSSTDDYKIRKDVNDEVEETTCSKCGEEKNSSDEYCDDCKNEMENEEE